MLPIVGGILASAIVLGAVAARIVLRHQRGTLDWRRERITVIGAFAICASLPAVSVAGPEARLIIPPIVMSVAGLLIATYDWGPNEPRGVRTAGLFSFAGGLFWFVLGLVTLVYRPT